MVARTHVAFYDRQGREPEVPAGCGSAREALVEALRVGGAGADLLVDSDMPTSAIQPGPMTPFFSSDQGV